MSKFKAFDLPIAGYHFGIHVLEYNVDSAFFKLFESSYIEEGLFDIKIELDKRSNLIVLQLNFDGVINSYCDRCAEQLELPVKGNETFLIKYDENPREEEEVIYILPGCQELNIAHLLYEALCLAVPIIKTHESAGTACNIHVEEYFFEEENTSEEKENPIWDALKNISNIEDKIE